MFSGKMVLIVPGSHQMRTQGPKGLLTLIIRITITVILLIVIMTIVW